MEGISLDFISRTNIFGESIGEGVKEVLEDRLDT
jgi:hypothetical protein